eukprot:c12852_g1_i1.p1 GENE.c12852_g1_i1~~c12852_g1_i1.p1  ORF type:complete len:2187 (-),score=588.78 c12852_g1_i1:306-6866(-)
MADHKFKIYEYRPNMNLVLTMERDNRVQNEPSGEPETLWGKLQEHKFGDKVQHAKPQELSDKIEKSRKRRDKKEKVVEMQRNQRLDTGKTVMEYGDQEGIWYRPKTKQTRAAFELLLNNVGAFLGDVPQDVLRGAADEVLSILKDDNIKDPDRKTAIEEVIKASVSNENFAKLISYGKSITDYGAGVGSNLHGEEHAIDEDLGVTVLLDEDDDSGDSDLDEVNDAPDMDDLDETKVDTVMDVTLESKMADAMDVDDDAAKNSKDRVDVSEIDKFWLQRQLRKYHVDANDAQKEAEKVLAVLEDKTDDRFCENRLVQLLKQDRFSEVRLFLKNRWQIVCCYKLAQAEDETTRKVLEEEMMQDPNLRSVLAVINESRATNELRSKSRAFEQTLKREALKLRREQVGEEERRVSKTSQMKVLDLDSLAFKNGSHLMSNKELELPKGSFRSTNKEKGYEEVHVPALKPKPMREGETKILIKDLPDWAQPAFKGMAALNRMQSACYEAALFSPDNVLLCAPTAAGKTNVAMLTMLHEIGLHRTSSGAIDLDAFKIVYIAPMKALVQEVVGNFKNRLSSFNISVKELTGDMQLTKQQIAETQVIVTTPEKWDIITRKSGDRTYTSLVRLMIIDEIHLLHDSRGPVLEAIVARTIRSIETTQEMIRLVGLSATLPNYADVAAFMRVKPDKGLFVFDNSYRPVGLQQQYIGITEKKAIKRHQIMNELTYERVLAQQMGERPQVLVFVHSRKDTVKTAKTLRDMALQNDTLGRFLKEDSASREILATEAETAKSADLKDLLPYGFAIHHAGLARSDRTLVEDLFASCHIPVLVSTATLAWGVNLPAHTVIIKGTQIYDPEKSAWVELSSLDVMQMLGRAGRPQFDTTGEGIVITSHQEMHFYLSLLNQQLPIESQFVSRLPDMLLAEIVLGTVNSLKEGMTWLGYTYLYMRMLRNPTLYGCTDSDLVQDRLLEKRRADMIHSAATVLDKCNLIRYDYKGGNFQVTELGRVASHFYVTHKTMSTFNEHLKPTMSDIDIFRVFSLAGEFQFMRVREEEKVELEGLINRCPIPVKESIEEASAKVNVLLQSYISQLRLDGLALVSDMVYVTQSAGRLVRAMFEIALRRGWASMADKLLDLCKMIDKRMWRSQHPLRQFKGVPEEVIKKLEKKNIEWPRYYDMNAQELGELVSFPKLGKKLHQMIAQFPKLELQGHVQPITRSILKVELTITADFQMDDKIHGATEPFWIIVEDVDSEIILHHEQFLLKSKFIEDEHPVTFFVPLMEPLPPQYFVRVVSDRWLHSETVLPVSFRHLILPEKYPPHTELLDLQPLPVSALRSSKFEALFEWKTFNPIQTQVFMVLYNTDENVLVGAPTGSGKTVCAEFAILRALAKEGKRRIVYVATLQDIVKTTYRQWEKKFGEGLGKDVGCLTGETAIDLKLLEKCDIILSTAENWDMISRRWKQRKSVQNVDLFIVDEMHLIGVENGPVLEVVVSRMRNIATQTEKPIRIVGLTTSLGNAKDLGEWIGASSSGIFNFHPNVRPVPLEIHLQGFDIPHFASRMLAMGKPTYHAINTHTCGDSPKPAIVYVASRKLAKSTALELLTFAASDNTPKKFLLSEESDVLEILTDCKDETLKHCCTHGVGFVHEGLSDSDRTAVLDLFEAGAIQLLVVNHSMCWALDAKAHLVVVMGTQYYHGREHRYSDYSVTEILQMMGQANRPNLDNCGKAVVMCLGSKKTYYKKFLFEPLPCESHLDQALADHMCAEIVTKTVENKQDAVDYLTWTFLYRRLTQNPNYYNLQGVSYRHLSDHLSELVETTLADLEECRAITVQDEMNLVALNLGMIASYYYIHCTTVELFSRSLTDRTKLKGLIEILCSAAEFEETPIRHHEDSVIRYLAGHVPQKIDKPKYTEPATKVNVLLQTHFSRLSLATASASLAPELEEDKKELLATATRLLLAMVDVISSSGWLSPALACMELSQMVVQGLWDRDSVFLQIPHFTHKLSEDCHKIGLQGIFDFIELEDKDRGKLLGGMTSNQVSEIALWCNRYPNIDCTYALDDPEGVTAGDMATLTVTLERDFDSPDSDGMSDSDKPNTKPPLPPVIAPRYPKNKEEGWWLVVGDPKTKKLLGIKRVLLQHQATVKVEFEAPAEVGKCVCSLFFMCDSYMGCDQEYEVELDVKEGTGDDSDGSGSSSGDGK